MLPHHTKITKYFFLAFLILLFVYGYFEARNLLWGPQISLGTQEAITVDTELIEISGTVKNVIEITLSGRSVLISDEGVFSEELLLSEGLNEFIFEAKDKFGREKTEILEVVYKPSPNTDIIEEQLKDN
ncbi:hypothetical protein COB52_01300 [Candidatus Kaiserbacteria bacterium]|nr:MAG: hypothetical protein COB52_01300 [Candidatus Kaiserbacteria bacterium]